MQVVAPEAIVGRIGAVWDGDGGIVMETIPITQSQARMQMSEALQKLKAGTGYPTAVALLHFPATAEANWYPMQPPVLTGDLRAHALWRQLHQRTVADLAQVGEGGVHKHGCAPL